jgi:hypothetical protein
MKKSDKKAKTKKAKTTTSALYDCCWYEPFCYDLCCGGVAAVRRFKWFPEISSPQEVTAFISLDCK